MQLDETTRDNIRRLQHIAIDRPGLVPKSLNNAAREMNHLSFQHYFIYKVVEQIHGLDTMEFLGQEILGPLELHTINKKCREIVKCYEKLLAAESNLTLEIDMNSKCYQALIIGSAYADEETDEYAMRILEAAAIGSNGAML